jgi:tetratricopeptide (TPR) repeat protein
MWKKVCLIVFLLAVGLSFACPQAVLAYDFGDHRSVTLTTKAWKALGEKDLDAVLAYTNKCVELYGVKAKEMQAGLKDYVPTEKKDMVFAYWALNDVSTALFIQGEALREAGKKEEAKAVYQKIVNEFSFGQCWDTNGWFWKPAEAAKAKINMIETGSTIDFGDSKSNTLVSKAWDALAKSDLDAVNAYVKKCVELYEAEAKKMQASLTEYAWESNEQVFSFWALNDVGTILFIQGEANKNVNKLDEAKAAYKRVVEEFSFAQCWDPAGWFWKPAEAAKQKLEELNAPVAAVPAAAEAKPEVVTTAVVNAIK